MHRYANPCPTWGVSISKPPTHRLDAEPDMTTILLRRARYALRSMARRPLFSLRAGFDPRPRTRRQRRHVQRGGLGAPRAPALPGGGPARLGAISDSRGQPQLRGGRGLARLQRWIGGHRAPRGVWPVSRRPGDHRRRGAGGAFGSRRLDELLPHVRRRRCHRAHLRGRRRRGNGRGSGDPVARPVGAEVWRRSGDPWTYDHPGRNRIRGRGRDA